MRSRTSSFKWEYPLLSLRSSSSFLRLLPRLLVTSNSSFIFPSITCFRRQFLRKMWPIQLAFRFLIIIDINIIINIEFGYTRCAGTKFLDRDHLSDVKPVVYTKVDLQNFWRNLQLRIYKVETRLRWFNLGFSRYVLGSIPVLSLWLMTDTHWGRISEEHFLFSLQITTPLLFQTRLSSGLE